MQALFLAVGKGFKKNARPSTCQNVDLYNVMLNLLNIPLDEARDGSESLAFAVLNN